MHHIFFRNHFYPSIFEDLEVNTRGYAACQLATEHHGKADIARGSCFPDGRFRFDNNHTCSSTNSSEPTRLANSTNSKVLLASKNLAEQGKKGSFGLITFLKKILNKYNVFHFRSAVASNGTFGLIRPSNAQNAIPLEGTVSFYWSINMEFYRHRGILLGIEDLGSSIPAKGRMSFKVS